MSDNWRPLDVNDAYQPVMKENGRLTAKLAAAEAERDSWQEQARERSVMLRQETARVARLEAALRLYASPGQRGKAARDALGDEP